MLKCDCEDCEDAAVFFAEIWFDHKTPTFIKWCKNKEHFTKSKDSPAIDLRFFDGEVRVERLTEEEFIIKAVMKS